MGKAIQFSPGGFIPIPDPESFDATALNGAHAAPAEQVEAEQSPPFARPALRAPIQQAASVVTATAKKPASASSGITPRTVLKAARMRVKEIRAELRIKRALEKELAQLERLLAATKKPLASLTPINSRRAG